MSTPLTSTPTPPLRPPSSAASSHASPATSARAASPVPVPVFAPRPLRVPPQNGFQRSLLSLEPPRTPSPGGFGASFGVGAGSPPVGGAGRVPTPGDETIRIYSPARDALDDFFKVVRRSSPALNLREILGGWVANNPSACGGSEIGKERPSSSSSSGSRVVIELPSSPVSRNLTRNPIIFNSQFDMVTAQRLKMSTSPMQEKMADKNPEKVTDKDTDP